METKVRSLQQSNESILPSALSFYSLVPSRSFHCKIFPYISFVWGDIQRFSRAISCLVLKGCFLALFRGTMKCQRWDPDLLHVKHVLQTCELFPWILLFFLKKKYTWPGRQCIDCHPTQVQPPASCGLQSSALETSKFQSSSNGLWHYGIYLGPRIEPSLRFIENC